MQRLKTIVITVLVVSFLFALGDYLVGQVQEKKRNERELEDVFVDERNEVFRLYEQIGAAMESDDISAACIEVSKTVLPVQTTCFRNYMEYGSYSAAALAYCGSFYRDIANILSEECDVQTLQTIRDVLYKVITLYDANQTSLDDFYFKLTTIQNEMESLAYLY